MTYLLTKDYDMCVCCCEGLLAATSRSSAAAVHHHHRHHHHHQQQQHAVLAVTDCLHVGLLLTPTLLTYFTLAARSTNNCLITCMPNK